MTERLDALADANRRTDEQAAGLVQHVNADDHDARGADRGRRSACDGRSESTVGEALGALDAKIASVDTAVTSAQASTATRLDELQTSTAQRIDEVTAAAEARDAEVAGDLAAMHSSAAEAMAAATARFAELEKQLSAAQLQLATVATKVDGIDQDAIEDLKGQMSAAIGEAMLVRIELDRVQATIDEKLDRTAVRLGEIEAPADGRDGCRGGSAARAARRARASRDAARPRSVRPQRRSLDVVPRDGSQPQPTQRR